MEIVAIYINGKYYGNNHTISGIYINNSSDYQGLFGRCSGNVEIKDLGIINSYIKGKDYIGGIVGYFGVSNEMYATNLHSEAIIIGNNHVGGIIGEGRYTTIDNCYNIGFVSNTGSRVGGIAGSIFSANIINSYNEGIVRSTSSPTGGIVGDFTVGSNDTNKAISDCYNSGIVEGTTYVGGIVGNAGNSTGKEKVIKSYNIGSVLGTDTIGGISGRNYCYIQECYNAGNINGTTNVGGISGGNGKDIATERYTYNVGSVTGDTNVGGIIGRMNTGNIYYSYNVGEVIANNINSGKAGGIVGYIYGYSYSPSVNYCYNLSSSIKTLGSGSWTYCGGIVGDTGYYAYLRNCYNLGDMTGSLAKDKGGIARKYI